MRARRCRAIARSDVYARYERALRDSAMLRATRHACLRHERVFTFFIICCPFDAFLYAAADAMLIIDYLLRFDADLLIILLHFHYVYCHYCISFVFITPLPLHIATQ